MSSILKVDTINEVTSANGVTVDGLSIKDSKLVTADSVVTANITNSNITVGKMAANSVDSNQYVDGSIDTIHIADANITVGKMAANSVDSNQYVDGSIDTIHIADANVTLAKLSATGTKNSTTFLRGDNTFNVPSVASLSTASGSAPSYSARSWVNFDGDGTVSIRASGNVSSVTDQGTGDYTVNFSTAMSDTNFSCVGSSGLSASGAQTYLQLDKTAFSEAGSAQVACRGETNNRADSNLVCVGIFR